MLGPEETWSFCGMSLWPDSTQTWAQLSTAKMPFFCCALFFPEPRRQSRPVGSSTLYTSDINTRATLNSLKPQTRVLYCYNIITCFPRKDVESVDAKTAAHVFKAFIFLQFAGSAQTLSDIFEFGKGQTS